MLYTMIERHHTNRNNMEIPTKHAIAEEIRTQMAIKNIRATELADRLKVTKTTMTNIRYGKSSFELMKTTLDCINSMEANK